MALTARVAASERGQRTSFNSLRADDRVSAYERNGVRRSRDIEGKAARVAVEPSESERDTISFHRQAAGNRGRGVDDGELRPEGGRAVVAAVSPAKML
jgi:hypothetical protein